MSPLAPVHAAWKASQRYAPTGDHPSGSIEDGAWETLYATAWCSECQEWQGPFLTMGSASQWLKMHLAAHPRPWSDDFATYRVTGHYQALWPPWDHDRYECTQETWMQHDAATVVGDRLQTALEAFL